MLNQTLVPGEPPAQAKDLNFKLPPGLVGNPTAFPQCPEALFVKRPEESDDDNVCPADTAIGVAEFTINLEARIVGGSLVSESYVVVPLFNLTPAVGEPARFGFYYDRVPVYLDTSVRTGSDYGVTVSVDNIVQQVVFMSSRVTFWGVPGDPRHNNARGWSCIDDEAYIREDGPRGYRSLHHPPARTAPRAVPGTADVVHRSPADIGGNGLLDATGRLLHDPAERSVARARRLHEAAVQAGKSGSPPTSRKRASRAG